MPFIRRGNTWDSEQTILKKKKTHVGFFRLHLSHPREKSFQRESQLLSDSWVTDLSWTELKEWLKAIGLDQNGNGSHLWKLELWVTSFFLIMSFWVFQVIMWSIHSMMLKWVGTGAKPWDLESGFMAHWLIQSNFHLWAPRFISEERKPS